MKEEINVKIYRILTGIALAIALLFLGFLCWEAINTSMICSTEYIGYNWQTIIKDSLHKNFFAVVIAFAGFALVAFLSEKNEARARKISKIIFIISMVVYAALGLLFVIYSPYYPTGDQINTTAAAAYALEGNYLMFTPLGYIGIWPFQKGLVLLYEIAFKIFGSFNYLPIKIITVFFNIATISMGYAIICDITGKAQIRLFYNVLAFLFVPYLALAPYAYGDLPSILGIMLLFFSIHKLMRDDKTIFAVTAALGAIFAVFNRGSAWIALVTIIIVSLLYLIKNKKWKPLLWACVAFLLTVGANKALALGYEIASGYTSETGSPEVGHIAMGMQETDGACGVFNRYQQTIYEAHNGDIEATKAEAMEYIKERLQYFSENKEYAWNFYRRKLDLQWIEPLFECNTHTYSFKEGTELTGFFLSFYKGKVHDYLYTFMDRYQSVVYVFAFIFVLAAFIKIVIKKEEVNIFYLIPIVFFIGGFLFSIIWEAKARYNLPYFFFLLMLVPAGMEEAYLFISNILIRIKFKRGSSN